MPEPETPLEKLVHQTQDLVRAQVVTAARGLARPGGNERLLGTSLEPLRGNAVVRQGIVRKLCTRSRHRDVGPCRPSADADPDLVRKNQETNLESLFRAGEESGIEVRARRAPLHRACVEASLSLHAAGELEER